jgi:hypothetical protein
LEGGIVMKKRRYTIRSLPEECIERLREVKETSGLPIGRLVDDAVTLWWDSLPTTDDDTERS